MIPVTAAIIEKNGKILIAKRKKGDANENKWEFPGGKIKPGETPEECLKRELFEEFGINTNIKEFICSSKYHYDHISIELLAYKTDYLSGDFKLIDHDEIVWVSINQFDKYDFAEADLPIIAEVKKIYNYHEG